MATCALPEYKVSLIGDCYVGKTYLYEQYAQLSGQNANFITKTVPLKVRGSAVLNLFDTGGREQWGRSLELCVYCLRCEGLLIVFDLTRENTFRSVPEMVSLIRSTNSTAVLMLVGNKIDLVQEDPSFREVTFESAQALASSNEMLYMEVSAVTGAGVNEAFEVLLSVMHRRANETISVSS